MALSVTDNAVSPGVTYVYRARINDKAQNNKAMIAYVKVKCENFNNKYLLNNKVVKVTEGDENISFSFPGSKAYYAFNVERSDDGGATYKMLTNAPAFKLTPHGYKGETDFGYIDSLLTNYKKYRYRVWVSTPFADDMLLAEFIAMPRDRTPPPAPFLRSAIHIKPK
jgi:hypothetical protein